MNNNMFEVFQPDTQFANLMTPAPDTSSQFEAFNMNAVNPVSVGVPNQPANTGFFDNDTFRQLFGGKDQNGFSQLGAVPVATQALGGLAQSWMGLQQLNLAEDSLAFQKDAYNTNMANQTKLTNSQLADRQNARNAQAGGQVETTEAYMKKYGL